MSTRGIIGAFAVLCGVGTSLILPSVSSAGQTLAGTATAAAIHGDLSKTASSNVLGSANRARGVASQANQRRAYENEVIGADENSHQSGPAGKMGAGVDAANVVPFDDKNPVKGKTYATDGIVIFDGVFSGNRVIVLVRVDGPNKFQLLGFRPHDPSMPELAKNTPVNVTAVYAAKIKEPKTGSLIHGFDDAVFSAPQVAANTQAPNAAAAKPEKPTFESPLKGWAFRGTVKVDGKSTGVFVNDKRVKYAHAGSQLDEGVKVAYLNSGQARVVVDGNRFDLTPW